MFEDKHCRWDMLPYVLPEEAEKQNAPSDIWLAAWTSKAGKLPDILVDACSWSDARSWVTRGSWMRQRQKAPCSIANHKITSTRKPSRAQPACETAPATIQHLLALKGATALQMMKPAKPRTSVYLSLGLHEGNPSRPTPLTTISFLLLLFFLPHRMCCRGPSSYQDFPISSFGRFVLAPV